ncbi:MAG: hypothetical protein E7220_06025 [Clostridiales bacterium]|nr:hypothetical protein [Clostridiales bacterium]
MAKYSKYNRYHEAGEGANVNNVDRYGEPVRSLFSSSKIFTLHHHIDITDEFDNIVYQSESKFLSLHDKTDIIDAHGNHIAHIERKVLTIHERHLIVMEDGTDFELSNELFHLIKDITNIYGLGWQIRGNILGLNFELIDENGDLVALIGQKLISIHDKFSIDIYQPDHEAKVVAIVVALQHMLKDREASYSSGSGASSSGE